MVLHWIQWPCCAYLGYFCIITCLLSSTLKHLLCWSAEVSHPLSNSARCWWWGRLCQTARLSHRIPVTNRHEQPRGKCRRERFRVRRVNDIWASPNVETIYSETYSCWQWAWEKVWFIRWYFWITLSFSNTEILHLIFDLYFKLFSFTKEQNCCQLCLRA